MKKQISSNAKKIAESLLNKKVSISDISITNRYIELVKMGYPVFTTYTPDTIGFLEKKFESKKKVMKYVMTASKLKDANTFELNLRSSSLMKLILLLDYDQIIKFYNKLIAKQYSFHDITSNLPNNYTNNNEIEEEVLKNEVFNFLMKVFDYRLDNIYEVLPYMNYAKVRKSPNLEDMKRRITFIEMRKSGYNSNKVYPSELVLQDYLINDSNISFSKDPQIVFNIGRETNCCFRKGGAGEALLKPALESPLSGILYGNMGARWFSFVWEIIEFNKDTGLIEKNLVLDNIEAKRILSDEEFKILLDSVSKMGYNRVYCGYLRNDIPDLPQNILETIKDKPYHLYGFEKAFEKYGMYDDSKRIYTFYEEQNISDSVQVRRMNHSDLHRCGYIEKQLWGSNSDSDFAKINIEESPSYIIDNNTNIYGYFITEMRYFEVDDNGKYRRVKGKELNEWRLDNLDDELPEFEGLEKVLYISDMFAIKNRHVISSFSYIFNDLFKWCEENGIKKVSANPNSNSKPFVKRLEKFNDIEYITEENISAFKPDNSFLNKLNKKQVKKLEVKL